MSRVILRMDRALGSRLIARAHRSPTTEEHRGTTGSAQRHRKPLNSGEVRHPASYFRAPIRSCKAGVVGSGRASARYRDPATAIAGRRSLAAEVGALVLARLVTSRPERLRSTWPGRRLRHRRRGLIHPRDARSVQLLVDRPRGAKRKPIKRRSSAPSHLIANRNWPI